MFAEFEIDSELLKGNRKIWVQPASAGQASDCLIFLDAEYYIEKVQAPATIAHLQKAGDLPPLTSIYLSHLDIMARARDFTCDEAFALFLATDLCRWIKQTIGSFERFFLCGLSLSGLAAVFTALRYPDTFCGILAQSPSAWWDDEKLANSLPYDKRKGSRIWISVGDQETSENIMHSPVELFQRASQRDSVRRLAAKLEGLCSEVHSTEFSGGHTMACWAEELPYALSWLIHHRHRI